MLNIIASVFKYSVLVVVILVLSHIVEIKGTTISRHVENGLNWMGDFSPRKVTRGISGEVQRQYQRFDHGTVTPRVDAEVSASDEKQLHQVIQQSKHK